MFNQDIFIMVSIVVYAAIWSGAYLRLKKIANRPNVRVKQIVRAENIRLLAKNSAFFIFLGCTLIGVSFVPSVRTVTRDRTSKTGSYGLSNRLENTFAVDRFYIPFYFRGKWVKPSKGLLINDSDTTLVIFKTTLRSGLYTAVDSPKDFIRLAPGDILPYTLPVNVVSDIGPNEHMTKAKIGEVEYEYTLTFPDVAIRESRRIARKITERDSVFRILLLENSRPPGKNVKETRPKMEADFVSNSRKQEIARRSNIE